MADANNNTKRLVMVFLTGADKNVSISVDNPSNGLGEAKIKSAMETIVAQKAFQPFGYDLVKPVEAKIVVTNTNEYDLA